ncbi:MAG: asparagine--tRNA ligase, partial [Gammaproteobacteria bacterium]|nr:asparagine--tRNA ligase [Gammaproteobacteria bacterium]
LAGHIGERVVVQGWLSQQRSSGKIRFLVLRDGTGLLQCVVVKSEVTPELWESSGALTLESSMRITGTIKEDKRSPGGVEMVLEELQPIQIAD